MGEGYHKISNGEGGSSVRTKLNAPLGRLTERSPLFTIRFDDGLADVYTKWKPFLDTKGVIGVSCVIATYPDVEAGYMTWTEIAEIEAAGWEITSHGNTNVDWRNITNSEIDSEIADSYNTLVAQGLTVRSIVPPFFSGQSIYGRQKCREYYRSAGTGYTVGIVEGPNPQAIDLYNICAARGDISGDYIATTPEGIAAAKVLVDEMETNSSWMIYFMHTWSQDLQDGFEEILDYVLGKSIDVVTYDEALDTFEPYSFVGRSFGVSEDSVMINEAHGAAVWVNNTETHLGIDAGEGNKGSGNTLIGHWAGKTMNGTGVTCIGNENGYQSTGSNCTYFGYRAGYRNLQSTCVFIGNSSGYDNNAGHSIGIGHQTLRDNTGYG
ncbi:hypothetical protein LCGC14_2630820, partial [marine sediment metagenome]